MIEMSPNKLLCFNDLLRECKLLMKDKIKILYSKNNLFIAEKTKKSLEKNDSIQKWSFGIVTDGKRQDWLEKEIDSIVAMRIPNFEIIICGPYNGKKRKFLKILPFESEKPLIGKKKNMICSNAKYENLCITHNKFIFDKHWYEGMKKYSNYFEVLSCIIHDEDEDRAGDWITYGTKWNRIGNIALLRYNDWDKYGYIDGGFYILKKSVWNSVKWDEGLEWGQKEDLDLSRRFYENGFVARFNPYSFCYTLKWNHGKFKLFDFDNQKLGPIRRSFIHKVWYVKQLVKKHFLRRI